MAKAKAKAITVKEEKEKLISEKGELTKAQNKALLEAVEILKKAEIPSRLFYYNHGCWIHLVIVSECPQPPPPNGPPTRCYKCGRTPFANPCPTCCSWVCAHCGLFNSYNKATKTPHACTGCSTPRATSPSCPPPA